MNQKNLVFAVALLVVGVAVGYAIGNKKADAPPAPAASEHVHTEGEAPHDMPTDHPPAADRVPVDLAAMEARLKANPKDVDAFLSILEEHAAQGKADQVVPKLEQAATLAGDSVPALLRLADLASAVEQGPAALAAAEKAIRKDPSSAEAYRLAGMIAWHTLNDNEKAIRYWTKYLELEPTAPNAELIRRTIEALKNGGPGAAAGANAPGMGNVMGAAGMGGAAHPVPAGGMPPGH